MKFSILHKVFSIVLSLLVLVSSLSLTIEKHFCGGVLVDVAVFTEVEKCSDDIVDNGENKIVEKSCCKDEVDFFKGLDEIITNSFEDLDDLQKQVLFAYSFSYINLFEDLPNLIIPHKDYVPPILIKDIQVLDEIYLI
ncbi:hypothetical protein [uncultured Winogradskyella sp.]|uniref:HYC_CC_PP family protein n=1 Tax=uncultured Winogradskyella sp. TaxID=395353 RepID=UPI00261E332F|nr:hypothetical protein [uncultured Winogradskyella sp.]